MTDTPLQTLPEREGKTFSYLTSHCQGQHAGIPHKDLAALLSLDTRQEREAVSNLVVNHWQPVGTSHDHGVFCCRTLEDFDAAIATLQDITKTTNQRIHVLITLRQRLAKSQREGAVQCDLFTSQPPTPEE